MINFIKFKSTIRSSYMIVHTCCCILFCIKWFVSKLKREFKNTFENLFGILEKKKKRNSFPHPSLSSFWPAWPHFPHGPTNGLAHLSAGVPPSSPSI
jgi:hypothetical protein